MYKMNKNIVQKKKKKKRFPNMLHQFKLRFNIIIPPIIQKKWEHSTLDFWLLTK